MRFFLACLLLVAELCDGGSARAWDRDTHRMITRLAVAALPDSPLKAALERNESLLEQRAVEPDSILKERYGRREEIRHYIDLELYSPDTSQALSGLNADLAAMKRKVGEATLQASGTLPWSIEDTARKFGNAWRKGNCAQMLREGGYLSHYVADASQPLHGTIHYDGYSRDRGIHARIESAVDYLAPRIEPAAAREVKVREIDGVWPVEIEEIRRANALVRQFIDADRKARKVSRRNPQYANAFFAQAGPATTRQIADAASVLASIWLYEWKAAGSPARCGESRGASGADWSGAISVSKFTGR